MRIKPLLIVLVIVVLILAFALTFSRSGSAQQTARDLLATTAITINGQQPWDIIIHDDDVYTRVIQKGSLGLGEAYMDGLWESPALDQFFYEVLRADVSEKININWNMLWTILKYRFLNLQTQARAADVARKHYDLSNTLFEKMLDPLMVYSCGFWKNAHNLAEAQEEKLNLICKKLGLKPGMRVLDIGCGWGGFARYAAKNYGVQVVGITVSREQAQYAQEFCKGLPVTIRLQDYRDLKEQFDRIVSVGMFEHVGFKNYDEFMKVAHACLKDNGLFLLHTIGSNTTRFTADPWIETYIFPNGMLPSMAQIASAAENRFIVEDWHNFGADYDKTLMAWYENFNKNWPSIKQDYDERFYRMWKYYLLSCAGLFRARKAQLWQLVLAKEGSTEPYISIR